MRQEPPPPAGEAIVLGRRGCAASTLPRAGWNNGLRPPYHRDRAALVLPSETAPPEGARSSCLAPLSVRSSASSSSPPPSIDLGFGEETCASHRVGWRWGLEEGLAGRREAPAGRDQPPGSVGGQIRRGCRWKPSRMREIACPLVLRRREYFRLFFCFSFFWRRPASNLGCCEGESVRG
jgi:hypothetical protein